MTSQKWGSVSRSTAPLFQLKRDCTITHKKRSPLSFLFPPRFRFASPQNQNKIYLSGYIPFMYLARQKGSNLVLYEKPYLTLSQLCVRKMKKVAFFWLWKITFPFLFAVQFFGERWSFASPAGSGISGAHIFFIRPLLCMLPVLYAKCRDSAVNTSGIRAENRCRLICITRTLSSFRGKKFPPNLGQRNWKCYVLVAAKKETSQDTSGHKFSSL